MKYLELDKQKYKEDVKAAEERRKEFLQDVQADTPKYMALAGIRKRYQDASLDKIKLPARVINPAKNFIAGKIPGLFLTGRVGSGKTYLACAIAKELLLQGQQINFISVPQMFQDIRATFQAQRGSEERIIKTLSECDCLILDDLGAEKQSDFALDRLYLIIDYRYSEIKRTIITSNLTLNGISTLIHDRLPAV